MSETCRATGDNEIYFPELASLLNLVRRGSVYKTVKGKKRLQNTDRIFQSSIMMVKYGA